MHRRLVDGEFRRRFVCITFDDGYRDTLQWAYPILKQYEVPFAVYIPTSFPDRLGELWWLALEAVVARNEPHQASASTAASRGSNARTVAEKRDLLRPALRLAAQHPTEDELRQFVRDCARRYHVDIAAFCNELCMTWEELADARGRSAGDDRRAHRQSRRCWPRCRSARRAIGDGDEPRGDRGVARRAAASICPIRSATGPRRARANSASPPNSGFKTAVTTRPGVLFPAAPRSPDGAAAHLAQRRVPAAALCAGADVGRRDRDVERLPPGRRGVDSTMDRADDASVSPSRS